MEQFLKSPVFNFAFKVFMFAFISVFLIQLITNAIIKLSAIWYDWRRIMR